MKGFHLWVITGIVSIQTVHFSLERTDQNPPLEPPEVSGSSVSIAFASLINLLWLQWYFPLMDDVVIPRSLLCFSGAPHGVLSFLLSPAHPITGSGFELRARLGGLLQTETENGDRERQLSGPDSL